MNELRRKEWLKAVLTQLPEGLRILDAGAGELSNRRYCLHLDYVSQDFCEYDGRGDSVSLQAGEWDTSRIDLVCDISEIPEEDQSFDAILCSEVFEHLPDPLAALSEFNRLLKPGGTLIVTAPFCSISHQTPFHFASGFNRYWYEHHFSRLDFRIVELTANGNFFEFLSQELRRLPMVVDRYVDSRLGLLRRVAKRIVLDSLEEFSDLDRGSSELLCFGFNVLAEKRAN